MSQRSDCAKANIGSYSTPKADAILKLILQGNYGRKLRVTETNITRQLPTDAKFTRVLPTKLQKSPPLLRDER